MIAVQLRFDEFVGRGTEMQFLRARFADAVKGVGSAVVITGAAGIGKSRLIGEFRERLSGETLRFSTGSCFAHRRGSLDPVVQLLRGIDKAGADAVNPPVEDQQLTPADRKARIFDAVLGYLENVAAEGIPLIVAIEDLHWADDATLELFAYLVKHVKRLPLLILATCRSSAVQQDERLLSLLPELVRDGARAVHLTPLGLNELRVLTNSVLHDGLTLPSDVVARVQDLSGGNPLYLEELLRNAIDRAQHGRRLRDRIPDTLKATILQRLRRLPVAVRELLTTASVLGDTFDIPLLSIVTQLGERQTIEALQRAAQAGIVDEMPDSIERYRFQHALIREVLYEELTAASAALLHASAAAALERRLDRDARIAELAYHWSAAAVPAKAIEYNVVAGDAAMAVCSYRDASRFYRYALNLVTTSDSRRADLCKKLGTALYYDGITTESKPYFWEAVNAYLAANALNEAAQLVLFLYRIYWYDGDTDGLARVISTATDLAPREVEPNLRCNLVVTVVTYLLHNGRTSQARQQFQVVSLEPGQDVRTQIAVQRLRAWFMFLDGNLSDAIDKYQTVLPLATALADPALLARHCEEFYGLTGRMAEMLRMMKYAYECCHDQQVSPVHQSLCMFLYADMLHRNGQLDAAVALLNEALTERGSFGQMRMLSALVGIPIALAADRPDILARCAHEDVIEGVFAAASGTTIANMASRFAMVYVANGEFERAAFLLHRAIEQIDEHAVFDGELLVMTVRYGLSSDLPKARVFADGLASKNYGPYIAAYCRYFDALFAAREGRASERRRCALLAAKSFEQIGMLLLAARATELAGRQKLALGAYRRLGAVGEVKRLERLFTLRGDRGGVLSRRQLEVARLIAAGIAQHDAATRLRISENTLKNHVKEIYRRLDIHSRADLVAYLGDRGS